MGTSLFFFVSFYPKTKKTTNVSVSLKRLRVLYCIWERVFDDKSILTSNHTTRQRANDVYADLHCWGYFEYILNAYDSYHVVSGSFPPCTIAWKHTHTILYIRAHTHISTFNVFCVANFRCRYCGSRICAQRKPSVLL